MPYFALHCVDRPDGLQARLAARDAHRAYIQSTGVTKLAGPLLDAQGEMAGSLLIIEVEDMAAAEAFGAGDPYRTSGVFERVDIHPFRLVLGSL